MVQLLSVLVVSACSILLVSANRHTSPYPVYPLGLSYLKTYLERTISGIRVDIADCNLLSDAQLAERIRTLAPRYIGLSLRNVDGANSLDRRGFLPQYKALADVIRTASDAPLIIGGAGFSIFPEAFMRELGADYGIHGEGEGPLAELIGALERGRTEIDIPSVYTRDGRRGSGRRSYLPSIEVQFEPELTGYYWKQSGMLNIQTKRGCPYDCIYCSYPSIDGRCVRTMDPEAIAENILRAKRDYGISYLFFTDSVFNIGPEYNVRLAETLIRRRTDIRWGAYFSPRGIDAEQMRLFRASGLTHIEFGTESFCDRTLEAYGKHFTFGDVERASRLALDEGVYYAHFLILGGYGDTRENVRETIENSRRMEYTVMFPYAGMRIYPHTRLAELAAKEGAIGRDDDLMAPSYYISRDFDLEEVRRAALATGKAWVFPDDPQSALADTLRLKRNKKGPLWEYPDYGGGDTGIHPAAPAGRDGRHLLRHRRAGVRTQRADRYGGQPVRCGRGAGRVRHRGAHRPVGRPEGGLHEPHDGPKGAAGVHRRRERPEGALPAAGGQQTRHTEHGRADGDERNASFGTDGMRRETRRRVPDENIPGRVMVRRKKSEASLVNKTSLRVRFSEVDSMQIVWHGEYVRYFEDGREAFGREFAGLGYMDIYASGYTAPIVELHLQYRKPLKVNDTAVVETRYIATEAAKVCFEYTIRSATDGEVVAEGSSTQVFLDSRGELQLLAPEFYRKWKERWEVK